MLMFMYYTVCYFTGIFYAVVRQISILFIDNKDSLLCTLMARKKKAKKKKNNNNRMVQNAKSAVHDGSHTFVFVHLVYRSSRPDIAAPVDWA